MGAIGIITEAISGNITSIFLTALLISSAIFKECTSCFEWNL